MSRLLGTLDNRSDELSSLVKGLSVLGDSVVGDGTRLAEFLDTGSATVDELADIMAQSDGAFTRSLASLGAVTDTWIANTPEFERMLTNLPNFAHQINRTTGQYGSFVSLYLCNFTLKQATQK